MSPPTILLQISVGELGAHPPGCRSKKSGWVGHSAVTDEVKELGDYPTQLYII